MRTWTLDEAKNAFGEVVCRALAHEPQRVSGSGHDDVIVVSLADSEQLLLPPDLVEFLQQSPLAAAIAAGEVEFERSEQIGRDAEVLPPCTSLAPVGR